MFQPNIFRETRSWVMHDLMRTYPFATLVTAGSGVLEVDHLPFVLHADEGEQGLLRGHLGAANPLCRAGCDSADVLVVFEGPQSYVTPSWYSSKADHGKVVPTWNYVCLHARGVLRLMRNAEWLLCRLNDLTAQHEGEREVPWSPADAPDGFVERQVRGLAGLEIAITDLQGVWKVSQNKTAADRSGVAAGLRAEGGAEQLAISGLVDARKPQ